MKKQILLLVLLIPFLINAQSYSGMSYGNYSGIHGVIQNPASLVGTPLRYEVNLFGANAFVNNDLVAISLKDLISGDGLDLDTFLGDATDLSKSSANNLHQNFDILGPSVMLNIKDNMAVGLYTRMRFITNVTDIDFATFDRFSDNNFNEDTDYSLAINESAINIHAWAEVGASYAMELEPSVNSKLKLGASIKRLQGIANALIAFDDLTIDYHADTQTMDTDGELSYGVSIDDIEHISENASSNPMDYFDKDAKGFGFDLGAVYQWAPGNCKRIGYKFKLGVSITDIGKIKYTKGRKTTYNLQRTGLTEADLEGDDFEATINSVYGGQVSNETLDASLPTAAHINFDWNIDDKFYLNLNTDQALSSDTSIISNYTLTPRFESKWISAFVPINYDAYTNFGMGAGVRLGPLYIGSNTVLSSLMGATKKADIYFGLKVPIYKKIITN